MDYLFAAPRARPSVGKNTKKQPLGSDSDTDSGETTADEARVQPKNIYAGITRALEDNKIIKLGSEWISKSLLTPAPIPVSTTANTRKDVPHLYTGPGKMRYCTTLSRCNVSEQEITNRVINLQVYFTFRSATGYSCMLLMKSGCNIDCKIRYRARCTAICVLFQDNRG